mgnify:FL=1
MNLIIVSGISGVGKSIIVKRFIGENSEKYELARSVTIRKARTENEYYTFVSREEGTFLETNLYQGSKKLYGTRRREVERIVAMDRIPVLEIDVNGKRQIESSADQNYFSPISIFITVPPATVYRRLMVRGEPMKNIVQRLKTAVEEINIADEYDCLVENKNPETAVKDMKVVISGKNATKKPDINKYRNELIDLMHIIQNTEGVGISS